MTDRSGQASPSAVAPTAPDQALEQPPADDADPALDRVRAVCPHLVADDGGWRALEPAREHRCAAIDPPAIVAIEKQRRLCLVAEHIECATYLAARRALVPDEADAVEIVALPGRPSSRWPVPRTAPVVIERGGAGLATLRPGRSAAQLGLVTLMVLAFAVLAIARLTGDGGTVATPSGGPSGAPSVAPSPTPRPTTSPSPRASPSASPASSPAASTTPSAAPSAATYRVRPGDNLSSIAARFGTTVAVLVELNDIKDPSLLRVGQVLKLP